MGRAFKMKISSIYVIVALFGMAEMNVAGENLEVTTEADTMQATECDTKCQHCDVCKICLTDSCDEQDELDAFLNGGSQECRLCNPISEQGSGSCSNCLKDCPECPQWADVKKSSTIAPAASILLAFILAYLFYM